MSDIANPAAHPGFGRGATPTGDPVNLPPTRPGVARKRQLTHSTTRIGVVPRGCDNESDSAVEHSADDDDVFDDGAEPSADAEPDFDA